MLSITLGVCSKHSINHSCFIIRMTGSGKLHSIPKQDLGLGCVHSLTLVTLQGYVENENIVLCEFGSQVKESCE